MTDISVREGRPKSRSSTGDGARRQQRSDGARRQQADGPRREQLDAARRQRASTTSSTARGGTRRRGTSASRSSATNGTRRQLLADRAYTELRDRIVTLQIPPGAPIDEDLLGDELKIGRTPVREAIKRLALENLVTVYPRRGTFASEINITDLADVSDVRAQLEGHAAYRAAQRLTDTQRAELNRLLQELSHSRGSDDFSTLMALDARVHRFIYRCAGNPYLEQTLTRYFNLSLRIWHLVLDRLPHLFARVHEHDELLRAIEAGEAEKARMVLNEHIATFEREIRMVL